MLLLLLLLALAVVVAAVVVLAAAAAAVAAAVAAAAVAGSTGSPQSLVSLSSPRDPAAEHRAADRAPMRPWSCERSAAPRPASSQARHNYRLGIGRLGGGCQPGRQPV